MAFGVNLHIIDGINRIALIQLGYRNRFDTLRSNVLGLAYFDKRRVNRSDRVTPTDPNRVLIEMVRIAIIRCHNALTFGYSYIDTLPAVTFRQSVKIVRHGFDRYTDTLCRFNQRRKVRCAYFDMVVIHG